MEVETYAAPVKLIRAGSSPPARTIQEIPARGLRDGHTRPDVSMTYQVFGKPLRDKELKTWLAFLPTHYSLRYGGFAGYAYDTPPPEVIERIDTARAMGVFDDIQIWTPEGRYDDPMAVGILDSSDMRYGTLYFPVVRWAESLASYKKIQWMVRWIRFVRMARMLLGLMVLASAFMFLVVLPAIVIGAWLFEKV